MIPPLKGLASQYLTPFDPKVLGGLRPKMNQFADGSTTHLTPQKHPTKDVEDSAYIPQEDPAPVCVPVEVSSVVVSPADNPLVLSTEYTFSLDGLSGTTPYFYAWFLNYVFAGSGSTFVHTLVDADVQNKDGSGLGVTFVFAMVGNACGIDYTNPLGSFPAQGTP